MKIFEGYFLSVQCRITKLSSAVSNLHWGKIRENLTTVWNSNCIFSVNRRALCEEVTLRFHGQECLRNENVLFPLWKCTRGFVTISWMIVHQPETFTSHKLSLYSFRSKQLQVKLNTVALWTVPNSCTARLGFVACTRGQCSPSWEVTGDVLMLLLHGVL